MEVSINHRSGSAVLAMVRFLPSYRLTNVHTTQSKLTIRAETRNQADVYNSSCDAGASDGASFGASVSGSAVGPVAAVEAVALLSEDSGSIS